VVYRQFCDGDRNFVRNVLRVSDQLALFVVWGFWLAERKVKIVGPWAVQTTRA
jgi:hypothetical protein